MLVIFCSLFTDSAAERVIMRSRQLVDVKKDDGFAALHLASLNGHVQVRLIVKYLRILNNL